jgi:hypothetical protein
MPIAEILPGVHHWSAIHPRTGLLASSYFIADGGVLVDPLVPADEGIEWFTEPGRRAAAIVLSNRHHYRESGAFHERFGCTVRAPEAGLHEFKSGEPVRGYVPGDALPGDLLAIEIDSISPDDSGLFLASHRALWLADSIVRSSSDPSSRLGWVSDRLMDNPPETKRGLLEAFERVLRNYDFQHLMLAHGLPLVGDGRAQLEQFVKAGGRTSTDTFSG